MSIILTDLSPAPCWYTAHNSKIASKSLCN